MAQLDPTLKSLVERSPADWLALAGLPVRPAHLIDADLSTVSRLADKVLSVEGPGPYLCHLEFQTGHDAATLAPKLNSRSALLEERHDLPVSTVVVLLRPEADSPRLTGALERAVPGRRPYRRFEYDVIRVWQLDPGRLLSGGPGLLPLAPVGNVTAEEVPGIIEQMRERLRAPDMRAQAGELWTAARIVLGLRFSAAASRALLEGVTRMKESTTYQEIVREVQRSVILAQGTSRFGAPSPETVTALEAVEDADQLERLAVRLMNIGGWAELFPPAPRPRRRRREGP